MTDAPQSQIVAFLKDPATHGSTDAVDVIETHAAYVFLVGDAAYKIKRAVRYDYLDYSTLPFRKAALERELELNSPAAPSIYRDVVPISRSAEGELSLKGTGTPVEWVLRMARFPAENELANIAARGKLDGPMAEALGNSVARYHSMAETRSEKANSVLMAQILDELGREFSGMGDTLPPGDVQSFLTTARERLDRDTRLLDARTDRGHVRRCHGDLHLRNIVLIDDVPVPFDALEFDEELGTCDVLYDLAFLLMDLRHREMDLAANLALNAYLRTAGTEAELVGLRLLPLFLGVRASISAMVAVQTARARGGDTKAEAEGRRYLDDACAALSPPPPVLIAIGGLSGTGKTTLARELAPGVCPMPGAVHLRSDIERKTMLDVPIDSHLPDAAYGPDINAKVYDRLGRFAGMVVEAGHSVIVDAVYLKPDERRATTDIAHNHGVPFAGLWLEAGEDVLISRVEARRGDASDADARVVRMQLDQETDGVGWQHIDASGPADDTLAKAQAALQRSGRSD